MQGRSVAQKRPGLTSFLREFRRIIDSTEVQPYVISTGTTLCTDPHRLTVRIAEDTPAEIADGTPGEITVLGRVYPLRIERGDYQRVPGFPLYHMY